MGLCADDFGEVVLKVAVISEDLSENTVVGKFGLF